MTINEYAERMGYRPADVREAMNDMGITAPLSDEDMSDISAYIDITIGVPVVEEGE